MPADDIYKGNLQTRKYKYCSKLMILQGQKIERNASII